MAKDVNNLAKYALEPLKPPRQRLNVSFLYSNYEREGGHPHKVPMHKHPSWQADLLLEGSCLFIDAAGHETVLRPWESILIAPESLHSFDYKRKGIRWMTFWFSVEGLGQDWTALRLEPSDVSKALFLSLQQILDAEDAMPSQSRANATGNCLAALLESSLPWEETPHAVTEGVAGQAMLWIERSEGRRIDIKEICDALGCSPSHLAHSFKEQFGRSLKSAVDERRAEVLARLVRQAELRPSQIASALGFRDTSELSRFCRRRLGASPRKLREPNSP